MTGFSLCCRLAVGSFLLDEDVDVLRACLEPPTPLDALEDMYRPHETHVDDALTALGYNSTWCVSCCYHCGCPRCYCCCM